MINLPFILGSLSLDAGDFLHWALASSVTLLVLDIFFCTEFLSWLAVIILAAWCTWLLNLPIQWSALVFIITLAIIFTVYYFLWNKAIRPFVNKIRLRHTAPDVQETLIGQRGVVRGEGEHLCVRCADELWLIHPQDRSHFTEGDHVVVTALEHGLARVSGMKPAHSDIKSEKDANLTCQNSTPRV